MDKLIIASIRPNAGKTGVIVGLAKALNRKIGYMKPLGDRLLYRKKQLWDHDTALMTHIFDLTDNPSDMSLGFDHSKLRYMYDEESTQTKLQEAVTHVEAGKELLLIEAGQDITYGASVHLDAISLAQQTGGKLLLVVSGDEDVILDDMAFARKHIDMTKIDLGGIIVNKLQDLDNFKEVYLSNLTGLGINVLGLIPHIPDLSHFSVSYLADRLFAKVISGAGGLNNMVQSILVGAMSVDAVIRKPALKFENSLIITGGDRTDMILYALESKAVAIILTNNLLPPSNIISRAAEHNIPLLSVTADTYEAAKQIDNLQPLLTGEDVGKIDLWAQLVREQINVAEIVGT